MSDDTDVPAWLSDPDDKIPLSEYHSDQYADDADSHDLFYQRYSYIDQPVEQEPLVIDTESIIANLNNEQLSAVTLNVNSGPVMVLAGAGTGKTSVLTKRIAWLVDQGVAPTSILAVTFTNKAAKEMRERLEKFHITPMPLVGTFHSIGLRILRLCPSAAGVRSGFTIMDESDTVSLWRRLFIRKDASDQTSRLKFDQKDPKIDLYANAMFKLKDDGFRHSSDIPQNRLSSTLTCIAGEMLDVYESERASMNLVDFSDLISASLSAMREHERAQKWRGRFTHMLVDEFQDTSRLQFDWVNAVMGISNPRNSGSNLFCVGDDCQSIYSFRGAVVENIDTFINDYGARVVMLEQNYRCGTDILSVANNVIANNDNGDRKKLWADGSEGFVGFGIFKNDMDESDWIAQDTKRHANESSAVLLRTRSAMLTVSKSMRKYGVAYTIVGATDFFKSREIKDAVALLRLVGNRSDYTAFERSAKLFHKVGRTAVEQIVEAHKRTGTGLLDCCATHKSSYVNAISAVFAGLDQHSDPYTACVRVCDGSTLRKQCEDDPDSYARVANLDELATMCGRFSSVSEFLEEMTLFAESRDTGKGVVISTIHAAKGLEWDVVYIPALSEGHLPSLGDGANIEEERRVMYVAMTRAKSTLNMTWAKSRMSFGKVIDCQPSRFIAESRAPKTACHSSSRMR